MHGIGGAHDRLLSKGTLLKFYLLNVAVSEGEVVLKLLAGKDETLLVRGDAFFVLDADFQIGNID